MSTRKPLGKIKVAIGDCVLMGMPGISPPGQWHIGEVLWFDAANVLVSQSHIGGAGAPFPCLHDLSYIRAVGTVAELCDIQRRAEELCKPLAKAIRDAEVALQDARDAVYRKLDEFAVAEPMRDSGGGI